MNKLAQYLQALTKRLGDYVDGLSLLTKVFKLVSLETGSIAWWLCAASYNCEDYGDKRQQAGAGQRWNYRTQRAGETVHFPA